MPNAPVPAAAEGVPSEVLIENRIRELACEISRLLDQRTPPATWLQIYAASLPMKFHTQIAFELDVDGTPLVHSFDSHHYDWKLIRVFDQIGHAQSALELVGYALEGMGPGPEMEALTHGIGHIRLELQKAKDLINTTRGHE